MVVVLGVTFTTCEESLVFRGYHLKTNKLKTNLL